LTVRRLQKLVKQAKADKKKIKSFIKTQNYGK
jgi:hypothetical protein